MAALADRVYPPLTPTDIASLHRLGVPVSALNLKGQEGHEDN